ncbi:MAG: hypothetical protein ACYCSF_12510 [Acidimicrobiales bacterium]
MAFAIGFGIFVLLMVILAGFVIRFSVQLNRDVRRGAFRRPPPSAGDEDRSGREARNDPGRKRRPRR